MNPWLRRLILLVVILVWLAIMLFPTFAVVLARNGQIQLGEPTGRHLRLFMLQDADTEGVGVEVGCRVAAPLEAGPAVSCIRTTVDYWIWNGDEAADAAYCQCFDDGSGAPLPLTPPACLAP